MNARAPNENTRRIGDLLESLQASLAERASEEEIVCAAVAARCSALCDTVSKAPDADLTDDAAQEAGISPLPPLVPSESSTKHVHAHVLTRTRRRWECSTCGFVGSEAKAASTPCVRLGYSRPWTDLLLPRQADGSVSHGALCECAAPGKCAVRS